jgi:suppressor of tumorigenicity protein 13
MATEDSTSAAAASGEAPFPPLYETGEDFDKASELKQEAADAKSNGDWEVALEKYTAAVLAAPPSALLYANRATALLNLSRPYAAERDCTEALNENPDSAKALRVRGKARKELGQWEAALKDVSASQTIDFDEGTVEDLKFLMEKHLEMEKEVAAKRNTDEDKLRKRAEEIKKAQEDAKREAEEAAAESMPMGEGMGGMPEGMGGGMPGGMPAGMGGMPGMGGGAGGMPGGMPGGMDMSGLMGMMADPEMREAMANPKVQKALQEVMSTPGGPAGLMSNPGKLQELMSDPEVGPVIQKLMSKMGGAGGMGGMPGMGGAPGGAAGEDDDDMPDLDEMPDLE